MLLQILDDGRMTDGHGRTVDFTNTVIIMTSNVGSQWIHELAGSDGAEMERRVTESLRATFKPEFLNRIDETIIFHSLVADQIRHIVGIQMERLARRLSRLGIELTLTEAATGFLAEKGYDPVYGARPLKRAIQQYVENPLSMEILKGSVENNSRIQANAEGDAIVFTQ